MAPEPHHHVASGPGRPPSLPLGDGRVDLVFGALADPTRRHLIEALAADPGATATGLARALPISRQAVAKHLALLHDAGLVSSQRRGREARFELDARPLADAVAWIDAVGDEWEGSLGRLRGLLDD